MRGPEHEMDVREDNETVRRARVSLTARAQALGERLARTAGRASPNFAPLAGAVPRDDLPCGASVGPYRIERAIGRGGMAVVYAARHERDPILVALKVARHDDDPGDPQCRERLLLEALILDGLSHPNTAGLHDLGVLPDGRAWLAMDLLAGESLTEILGRGPIGVRRGCAILADICRALTVAHGNGVVHRDLKPDNIVVERNRARVVDWGIARTRALPDARITEVGVVSGTPLYMSPEQARGREVDGRSDLYALGVIAFEMFCGAPPFDGASSVEILLQHINEKPALPGSLGPDLPAWLSRLIMGLLHKEPCGRPPLESVLLAFSSAGGEPRTLDDVLAELALEVLPTTLTEAVAA